MKQTAVEKLLNWLSENHYYVNNDLLEKVEELKELEKQQMFDYIKTNYVNGENSLKFHQEEFEKYYNETFKTE